MATQTKNNTILTNLSTFLSKATEVFAKKNHKHNIQGIAGLKERLDATVSNYATKNDLDGKANLSGATFTGNVTVAKLITTTGIEIY